MEKIVIPGAVEGEVDPPSSKSYAIRALAADFLAGERSILGGSGEPDRGVDGLRAGSRLRGLDDLCDDVVTAMRVVETLRGEGNVLDVGESGLAARLFTPIAALSGIPTTITGRGTLLKRPMTTMIAALRELGVEVTAESEFLPITVRGPIQTPRSDADGELLIDGSTSSQLLTGLLMALPLAAGDTTIRVENLRSTPYIDMTLAVMDRFGIDVDHRDYGEFYVPGNQQYKSADFVIEGDWSAASCLLVAGAIAGGHGGSAGVSAAAGGPEKSSRGGSKSGSKVTVKNLNPVSLQADVTILDALSRAGARIEQTADAVSISRRDLRAFNFDATDCPDLFPALAALAAACEGVSYIAGTERLRYKESDRADAIRTEFGRLGVEVDLTEPNVMKIVGHPAPLEVPDGLILDPHNDHRIAMSLAVSALRASAPVTIKDAECVAKSYANFWRDFEELKR
jgi:3-phosphoshikimate 1-carboxyvinyltransferase